MQVEGYQYQASQNRMRMRIFNVLQDVKQQHAFVPIVSRPAPGLACKQHVGLSHLLCLCTSKGGLRCCCAPPHLPLLFMLLLLVMSLLPWA